MQFLNRISENIDKLVLPVVAILGFAFVYSLLTGRNATNTAPPDDNWFQTQVIESGKPVVVKFGADWCGPCRALDKVIAEYSRQGSGVDIVMIDVDERGDLASHYKVSGIPKVMMFNQGKPTAEFTGSRSLQQFTDWIEANR